MNNLVNCVSINTRIKDHLLAYLLTYTLRLCQVKALCANVHDMLSKFYRYLSAANTTIAAQLVGPQVQ